MFFSLNVFLVLIFKHTLYVGHREQVPYLAAAQEVRKDCGAGGKGSLDHAVDGRDHLSSCHRGIRHLEAA